MFYLPSRHLNLFILGGHLHCELCHIYRQHMPVLLRASSSDAWLHCMSWFVVFSVVAASLMHKTFPLRHEFPFFAAQLNAAIGALLSGCLLIVMPKDWARNAGCKSLKEPGFGCLQDSRASPCHLTYWFRLAALLSAQCLGAFSNCFWLPL